MHKITCPGCQAILRSPGPFSPGTPLKCPGCQALFRVPGRVPTAIGVAPGVPVAAPAAPVPSPLPPAAVPATPGMIAATPAPVSAAAAALPGATPSVVLPAGMSRRKKAALVFGGAGGVLALTIGLVLLCFSGDSSRVIESSDDSPPEFVLPANLSFKPPAPKPLVDLTKEEEQQVAQCVAKGVEYLKRTQNANGSWGHAGQWDNYVCFAGLTLLECGVPKDDPVVQKAARFARERAAFQNHTYPIALFLLFFDKLDDPQDQKWIELLSMRLVAGQNAQGGWHYTVPPLAAEDAQRLRGVLQDLGRQPPWSLRSANPALFDQVPSAARNAGIFEEKPTHRPDDNSNTQFALLGLWTARRHKAPVDRALELVVRRFRTTQQPDGSYAYSGHRYVTKLPSMTCAGLLGLAVDFGLKDKGDGPGPKQDPAVQNALKVLARNIGAPNPDFKGNPPMTDMYFLWSIERVAVLYQLARIEGKDWYRWGLWMLSGNQRADGSWRSTVHVGHGDQISDTCFALLFLQRVNLAQDLTDKLRDDGPIPGFSNVATQPGKE